MPSIAINQFEIDATVIKLVPAETARKYQIVPLSRAGATLTIAMTDPTNVFAMDDVKFMTGYNVEPVVASESALVDAIEEVKEALKGIGIDGMTITEVRGHGRQKGHKEVYRGQEYNVDLLPKVKIEMVVPQDRSEEVVRTLIGAARTGNIGDGKIFTYDVAEAIRIRNEDRGEAAL